MNLKTISFILLIALTALYSCKEDSTLPPEDTGYSFFPYQPGDYRIYCVDSTHYDDFYDTVTTTSFNLKEVFESWFVDAQNRKCIRIERWIQLSDTSNWYLRDVWYSCLTAFQAERVEENVRYVRLSFPVRSYTEWDGNAFNDLDEQWCEYDLIDEPFSNAYLFTDSSVTVIQELTTNLIEDKEQYEIYARNIGLVYKKYLDVEKDFVTGDTISGVNYTWVLTDYGSN